MDWLAQGRREIYALTGYLQEGRRGLWVGCPKQNQSESRQYINLIPVYKGPILVPSVPSIAHLLLQTLKSLSSEPQPLICQLRQPRGLDGFYLVCFNKLLRAHHQPPPVLLFTNPVCLSPFSFWHRSFCSFFLFFRCVFPSLFPFFSFRPPVGIQSGITMHRLGQRELRSDKAWCMSVFVEALDS